MTGPDFIIGGIGDVASIMPVMDAAFDPVYGEAWRSPQLSGMLTLPGTTLMLAMQQGACQAFALFSQVLEEAELLLVAVHPAQQGTGLGKNLIQAGINHLHPKGVNRLFLEVRDGNPALHFYQAIGFVPVGRRNGYYKTADGTALDAITMARTLQ